MIILSALGIKHSSFLGILGVNLLVPAFELVGVRGRTGYSSLRRRLHIALRSWSSVVPHPELSYLSFEFTLCTRQRRNRHLPSGWDCAG